MPLASSTNVPLLFVPMSVEHLALGVAFKTIDFPVTLGSSPFANDMIESSDNNEQSEIARFGKSIFIEFALNRTS